MSICHHDIACPSAKVSDWTISYLQKVFGQPTKVGRLLSIGLQQADQTGQRNTCTHCEGAVGHLQDTTLGCIARHKQDPHLYFMELCNIRQTDQHFHFRQVLIHTCTKSCDIYDWHQIVICNQQTFSSVSSHKPKGCLRVSTMKCSHLSCGCGAVPRGSRLHTLRSLTRPPTGRGPV